MMNTRPLGGQGTQQRLSQRLTRRTLCLTRFSPPAPCREGELLREDNAEVRQESRLHRDW